MKKILEYNTQGKTLHMQLKLRCYEHNRTLAVLLYEKGCEEEDGYYTLTCCLDDTPGKNRAFIDDKQVWEIRLWMLWKLQVLEGVQAERRAPVL